jgi:hypothetical protein
MWIGVVAAVAWLALATAAFAAPPQLRIASPAEASAVLSARDSYVSAMSDADASIRLRNPNSNDRAALQVQMGKSARPFSTAERTRLDALIARTRGRVEALAAWLPPEILFIKSSEDLDGGWPHTRANAIILGARLPHTDDGLDKLFFHELWHVISRTHPERMDAVYALLGFLPCTQVSGWEAFSTPRLGNPDAVAERHVLPLPGVEGGYALPVLRARFPRYQPMMEGFGAYIAPQFVRVQRTPAGACEILKGDAGPVILSEETMGPALAGLATRDTNYVWHPEEMTADLFALLMTNAADLKDPHQIQRLAVLLGLAR